MDHAEAVPELAVPSDVPSLVVTCADAFNDDAMIRWPMPEATPAMLQELFRVILEPYVEFGVLWKIGGCDGGAAWLPPGITGRFDEIEQAARAAINPLTDDGGVRYATFWDWLGAHLPGEPCWFLDLVAVAPAAQGRGFGRRLVMHGLDLARADGCPAFLETSTPRNVPFYQSLGFQIVDEQRAPDGGPMIWFMQTPRLPGPGSSRVVVSTGVGKIVAAERPFFGYLSSARCGIRCLRRPGRVFCGSLSCVSCPGMPCRARRVCLPSLACRLGAWPAVAFVRSVQMAVRFVCDARRWPAPSPPGLRSAASRGPAR